MGKNENKERVNILNRLFLENENVDELELFSYFISSNPDFKYNVTYLTDQIQAFRDLNGELKKRFGLITKIVGRMLKQTPIGVNGYLVFDDLFKFKVNKERDSADDLEIINKDSFRFDRINKETLAVKFVFENEDMHKITETYRFCKKTKKELETKKTIYYLWQGFINNIHTNE